LAQPISSRSLLGAGPRLRASSHQADRCLALIVHPSTASSSCRRASATLAVTGCANVASHSSTTAPPAGTNLSGAGGSSPDVWCKNSFQNASWPIMTATLPGDRRRVERGPDGRASMDRARRALGADRAAAARASAALALPGPQAPAGPPELGCGSGTTCSTPCRRYAAASGRRADTHEAFPDLACCMICFRRLRASL